MSIQGYLSLNEKMMLSGNIKVGPGDGGVLNAYWAAVQLRFADDSPASKERMIFQHFHSGHVQISSTVDIVGDNGLTHLSSNYQDGVHTAFCHWTFLCLCLCLII